MYHIGHNILRSFSLCSCLAALALAGCAPDADPAPSMDNASPHLAPAPTPDVASDAGPVIYLAPGDLTVRWEFQGADLPTACAGQGVASVRLEVGLDAPLVIDCTEGAHRYAQLPAGLYSVGVVLLDAAGAVVKQHYEGVLLESGASAAITATF